METVAGIMIAIVFILVVCIVLSKSDFATIFKTLVLIPIAIIAALIYVGYLIGELI